MSPNREMNVPPSQFNMWGGGGGKWWLIEWSAKISRSILPQHPLQKRTCQKNELRYFRWNSGTISFPPNSWPAAGRRMWMTVNYNLHHAIAGFPDPRGFLREPQFPEGSPCFLRDIHRPKMDRLWIFYGSHGIFSTVFLHVFPQKEYYHTSCTMIELLSTVLILAVFELDHFPVHGFLRLSRGQGGAGRLLSWLRHNLPGLRLIANNEI